MLTMLCTFPVTWDMNESLDFGKLDVLKMEHGQMGSCLNVDVCFFPPSISSHANP